MNIAFAPSLSLKVLKPAVEFYKKAFGVTEWRLYMNPDGSIHVAELKFGEALFYLHEEMPNGQEKAPETLGGTSVMLAVFADDPDTLMDNALAAGARQIHAMKNFDYGLRQGVIEDPFGHFWTLQKKLGE
ncbi:MAG: VOC family protein [Bacteroidetes bacterium]|nr:VOC family protein [Bacteroidota bacterium]